MSDDGDPVEGGDPDEGGQPLPCEPPGAERMSPDAVRSLYETHGRDLLGFLIGVLRDVNAANDVLQITFRRVLEVGHTARGETIKGWLFKVALREALIYRRQVARQERHLSEYSADRTLSAPDESIEERLLRKEDVARLKKLMARLPADQLHVVRQRIYEEKTFAVIAAELHVPLGTVLTRMRLALEKLRKWLDQEGDHVVQR